MACRRGQLRLKLLHRQMEHVWKQTGGVGRPLWQPYRSTRTTLMSRAANAVMAGPATLAMGMRHVTAGEGGRFGRQSVQLC